MRRSARFGLVAFAALCLAGCAAKQKPITIEVDVPTNPNAGRLVHIADVVDRREFFVAWKDPYGHQLATEGVEDPAITARAIAQLRDAKGKIHVDFTGTPTP